MIGVYKSIIRTVLTYMIGVYKSIIRTVLTYMIGVYKSIIRTVLTHMIGVYKSIIRTALTYMIGVYKSIIRTVLTYMIGVNKSGQPHADRHNVVLSRPVIKQVDNRVIVKVQLVSYCCKVVRHGQTLVLAYRVFVEISSWKKNVFRSHIMKLLTS